MDVGPDGRAQYPSLMLWSLREEEVLPTTTYHVVVKGYKSG